MTEKKPYSKKRVCIICEKEYDAPSPQSRVCGDVCKKEVRKRAWTNHNKKVLSKIERITHKDCVHCGTTFELKSKAQRYCGEKCKWDAGVMKTPIPKKRKCEICKKTFSPSVHNQLYCNEKCYQKSKDDRRLKRLEERGDIKKKCIRCSGLFIITGGNNQYCSFRCKEEEQKEKRIEYLENNKETILERNKEYKKKNLKGSFSEERKCLVCGNSYNANNVKSKYCSKECKWKIQYKRRKDSGELKYDGEYMRKYHKERRDTDPQFNMIGRIRHRTREAIKRGGFTKKSKTFEMLGCEWETLKEHIENQFVDGMSWDNMKDWDLDHIYPLSWCDTIDELEIYAHYTNLQPLWRKDNQDKSDKFIG